MDDETFERFERVFDTKELARFLNEEIRADKAKALTTRELVDAFELPRDSVFSPFRVVDTQKLFDFLAKLSCPPMCVGHVNSTGWHQLCEQRAQGALEALGFTPPDLTPIPED